MEIEGWLKIHRKMAVTDLWLCEPFTKGQAWVDLILLANHKDGTLLVRGNVIPIKRGQVGWSQERLSHRWQWSRRKVSNFLKMLEMERQIAQQKNNVSSIITIINYDHYQKKEQQKEQQKHSRSTAEAQQKHTNKNEKNEKKTTSEFILPSWINPENWNGFVEMRNANKNPLTDRAKKLIINKLEKLKAIGNNPNVVLDKSVERGWQGVFELKENDIAPKPKPKIKTLDYVKCPKCGAQTLSIDLTQNGCIMCAR